MALRALGEMALPHVPSESPYHRLASCPSAGEDTRQEWSSLMKGPQVIALIVVLVVIAGIVVAKSTGAKRAGPAPSDGAATPMAPTIPVPTTQEGSEPTTTQTARSVPTDTAGEPAPDKALPKMLELGSVGCKPCAYMAPIIDSLEKELAGKVVVKFYDVIENQAIAEQYKVMTIPTQVFLDAEGKELFRHIGVFEKAEILAKLKELGMLKE